jgi:ferric iron reductase protein FhuF
MLDLRPAPTTVYQLPTARHPLDATLARLGALNAYIRVERGVPLGSGWACARELLAANGCDAALAAGRNAHPSVHPTIIASSFFNAYSWLLVATGLAGLLSERRVPDLSLDNVVVHLGPDGRVDALALRHGRFAALVDDAAARHPDATAFATLDELRRDGMQGPLLNHLAALVAAVRRYPSPGERVLWSAIGDRYATVLVALSKQLGLADDIPELLGALLGDLPKTTATGLLTVEHCGSCVLFARRGVCCYADKYPSGAQCANCPRLALDERLRRLQERLATDSAA